jgi:C1A family cysteine protease
MYQRLALVPLAGALALLAGLLVSSLATAQPPLNNPDRTEIVLAEGDNGRQLSLTEGHRLVIQLPANPSAGYLWQVEHLDTDIVARQQDNAPGYVETDDDMAGGPAQQVLRFVALSEGETTLQLALRREWESDTPPVSTFALALQAVGPFSGANAALTLPPADEPALMAAAEIAAEGLPGHFSWCERGKCTPIRDQGLCGSCWAFATVGVMESVIKIQDGVTRDLSEQYLVSCNTNGWSCNGGYWAHPYHQDRVPPGEPSAGAVYEVDFPYLGTNAPCGTPHPHHEKISSWNHVAGYGQPSVAALKQAIYAYGPVSVGVCVGDAFGRYRSGVFTTNESSKCSGANHAVVLVGWDDSQGVWYLRNSWGTRWGEGGMMRIGYGVSRVGWNASYVVYGQTPYMPLGGATQLTRRVFLPAIAQNGSATTQDSVPPPAPTPAPTPAPNPSQVVPANGGFEDGKVSWSEYSKKGWQVIMNSAGLVVAPHDGSWAAWLGGDHDEVSSISQAVQVPAARPYLAYWHWISSVAECNKDTTRVLADSHQVDAYDLCTSRNTGGWKQRVVDLSAYAGRSITLQITVATDGAGISNLYVDDVWFQSSPATVSAPPSLGELQPVISKSSEM